MKKFAIIVALWFLVVLHLAFGQSTTQIYTGTILDLSGNPVTSGQVTFTLAPPTDSTVPGTGRFTPTTIPCNINSNGTLSGFVAGVVSGACIVTANTSLSPSGTSYQICIQPQFATPGSCFYDYALGGTKDISTVAPTLSTGPLNYGGVPGPPGPAGAAGVGCGTGNCLVSNPAATQTATQPVNTSLNVVTSGTGAVQHNGNALVDTVPPSGSQTISGALNLPGNTTSANLRPTPAAIGSVPNLILSDDMDTDPDGLIQMEVLLHWMDTGQAKLLAFVADSQNLSAAPVARILLNYSGYSSVPVGAYQGGSGTTTFMANIVAQFNPGDTRANYPPCATTLRTALAAAANSSVTFVTTGFGTCLFALYNSAADGISTLTGQQLIKAKIAKFVIVAGDYPSGTGGVCGGGVGQLEFNFCAFDPSDWSTLLANMTSVNGYPPMVFLSFTSGINAGNVGIPASFPTTNPAQYGISISGFSTRPPWAALGIWYAVFGNVSGAFTQTASGTNTVNATTGANFWTSTPVAGQSYLINAQSAPFYESFLDGQNYTGAAWFMPANQTGLLQYQQLQCSNAYGCIYGGNLSPLAIGPYTESFGPTGNIEINRATGTNVTDFQRAGVSKMAIGVDDGTGSFMAGTNAGDSGVRITSGQKFYVSNLAGVPLVRFDINGGVNTLSSGVGSPAMGFDAGGTSGGGRLIATGSTTSTPNTMVLESFSSDLSVNRVLASMNAAGFVQLGGTAGKGVDQSGSATLTSVAANVASGTGTATITLGTGAGTGASLVGSGCVGVCDSVSGRIKFNSGTTPPTTGLIATVTLGINRTNIPSCVWGAAVNETTGTSAVLVGNPGDSTTATGVNAVGTALTASVQYQIPYWCGGQ